MTGQLRRHLRTGVQVWRFYRVQALLSVLGVVAGLGGLMLVLAIGTGARREMDAALGQLGAGTLLVRSPPGLAAGERIGWQRVAALDRLMGDRLTHRVPVVVRQLAVTVPGFRRDDVRVIGTTAAYAAAHRLEVQAGRFLTAFDVERRQAVCVLGAELGRTVLRRGGRLGARVQVGPEQCVLVGLLKPAARPGAGLAALRLPDFDQAAYLPVSVAATGGQARLDELLLRFRAERDLVEATGAVQRILEFGRAVPALEYVIPAETLRQKYRLQTALGYLLTGVTLVMLAVGGIGIMNMMLVNVLRRRPEIGLRRAVGATRQDILAQFVLESVLVAAAGGVAGVVLGIGGALLLGALLDWSVAVPAWSVPAGLAVSLGLGVACGGYPALQAASVEPIRTLNQG